MSEKTIDISVIICHHAGALILRCLDSLTKAYGNFETFVVTSAKDFHYAQTGVTLIYEQGGPDHKRNVAAKLASGKYLVFLDDDVEIRDDCLVNFFKFMEAMPDVGMAFAKIYNMEKRGVFDDCGSWLTWTGFLWARAGNDQIDFGQYDVPLPILASKSATCIINRKWFIRLGGYDENYFILGEETDLAWRTWLSGKEVWYVPNAVSWHAFGTSLKPTMTYYSLSRIHYLGAKNYVYLLCTNLRMRRLIWMLPIHLFGWSAAIVGFALRGQFRRSMLILTGIFWNIRNLNKVILKRKSSQSILLRSQNSHREVDKLIFNNPPFSYYFKRLFRYCSQGLHG